MQIMGLLVVFCKSIDTNLFICEMLEKTFCKIKGSLKHKTELCKFVGGGEMFLCLGFKSLYFQSVIADQWHFTFIWLAVLWCLRFLGENIA